MPLSITAVFAKEGADGYLIYLQDAKQQVEVRVPAGAFIKKAGSLTESQVEAAFAPYQLKAITAADRKFDAGEYRNENGRKVIWIRTGEL